MCTAGDVWTTDLQPLRTNWEKPYLTDAPHLILVFKQQYSLKADGSRRNHYYNELSVAIASGILITAIHVRVLNTKTISKFCPLVGNMFLCERVEFASKII